MPETRAAFEAMAALERGSIANPDERRMVGHYWLRAPQLAPDAELSGVIRETRERIDSFAASAAEAALEQLLGVISTDDILDRVFSQFCIGK